MRILLRIQLLKLTDLISKILSQTQLVVNKLLHSVFSPIGVSLKSKPVNLQWINYLYKAYMEKFLNYCSDASGTRIVSRFRYLDLPREFKDNSGYGND